MKTIKIKFLEFGSAVPIESRSFYPILARHFDIQQVENPDYVLTHGFSEHWQYNDCVKICLNGENGAPDFNAFDYVVGFDELKLGDRYLRAPLFARYNSFKRLTAANSKMSDSELPNRKFCSFVVSNANFCDPIREKFFKRLSQYKQVDSGGRYLNNIGGPVKDKLDFCRGYKFNIAFENSAYPGYTTEKIMEAYAAESVPIYFGNPTIETDFRLESMVRVKDESDIERAVEEIIRLDNDDAAYLAKCHERCFAEPDPLAYERELEAFLVHIFEQPLEQARRRAQYGHQAMMRAHMRKLMTIDKWIGKARKVLRR